MKTMEAQPGTEIKGWADITEADLLSQLIWSGLSEADGEWHYMNFTSDMSIWESSHDASTITILYKDDHLVQLLVTPGIAYDYLLPSYKNFSLLRLLNRLFKRLFKYGHHGYSFLRQRHTRPSPFYPCSGQTSEACSRS